MSTVATTNDAEFLGLLQRTGAAGITDLVQATHVTPTAVRQRLNRLMRQGLVERSAQRKGRGRPVHRYQLTEKGMRRSGNNFTDLALVLWKEIRAVADPEVRRGLVQRIARQMAAMHKEEVSGSTTTERMQSVAKIFDSQQQSPFVVEQSAGLPVLTAVACPYPELAAQDRGICAVERMLFSELVGQDVRLTDYRMEGSTCCRFETN